MASDLKDDDVTGVSTSVTSEAAQRYAGAVFDLALDTGAVDAVETGLNVLSKLVAGNAELARALSSPLIRSEDKTAVLMTLCDRLAAHDLVRRAVGVAAQNRRAGELPAIAGAFADRAARHRGSSRVSARVAQPLSADQVQELENTVSRALGRAVTVDVVVDPSILGGLQLRMGSRLIDASIRTKLNALTNMMKGA